MVQVTGTDPLLNEDMILKTLQDEVFEFSSDDIRGLCNLVLLACYDRKVGREFFAEMIVHSTNMQECVSEVESGIKMISVLKKIDPTKSPDTLSAAIKEWGKKFTTERRKMTEQFGLLCQCPTGKDPVS